jgi:hypothetical protein
MVPCVPSVTPLSVGQQRKNPDALIGRRGPRAETLQRMASPDTRITNPPNPTYSPNQRTYAGQRSNNREVRGRCMRRSADQSSSVRRADRLRRECNAVAFLGGCCFFQLRPPIMEPRDFPGQPMPSRRHIV